MLGEYVNNRQWNKIVFEDSNERFQDLMSYGVKFREENGKVMNLEHPLKNADLPDRDKFPPLVSEEVHWLPGWTEVIRKHVKTVGVNLMDRVMIYDLIKQEGRIIGAIGFPVDKYEILTIKAKAVVIAAGGGGFRPVGYPTHELTADGQVMAYKAGAEITGKEFVSPNTASGIEHDPEWISMYERFSSGHSASSFGNQKGPNPFTAKIFNAYGDEVPHRGMSWHGWIDVHYETHAGRGPVSRNTPGGKIVINGPGSGGSMHGHATAGIFPADTKCSVGIPGLYAAGDSLGTQFVGATYSGFGFATTYASVTGARAGSAAAEYVADTGKVSLDSVQLAGLKKAVRFPLERKGGFSPRWVTEILKSYMLPYFVMYIKHEERLKATLMNIEFIRDHLVPKMYANDIHELRLAHETKSMVMNAEMKLRSSMFRKESRGNHYREDYPKRNDPEWLAWVILKEEDGKMKVYKKHMPEEWRPDLSKSYDERYPLQFPEG